MQLYNLHRYYYEKGSERSHRANTKNFTELLSKSKPVVVSKRLPTSTSMAKTGNVDTPFEVIGMKKYDGHPYLPMEFRHFNPVGYQFNKETYAKLVFRAMKKAIEDSWDSTKFHPIPHSSGYDSRLIAMALNELLLVRGERWLGEVLFYESDGEAKQAKELLGLEGWGDYPFVVYNEGVCSRKYHERSISLDDVWKRYNGVSPYPQNVWYEPIEWLQEKGHIPKDDDELQPITGFGSNEIATIFNRFKSIGYYFSWIYRHAISAFIHKGHWIHPYYDDGLLRVLNMNKRPRYRPSSLSKDVIEVMAPSTMNVSNLSIDDRNNTVKQLDSTIMNKAVREYSKTWYGEMVASYVRPPNNLIEYNQFWACYNMAGHCQHLENEGYDLEVA